jgi:2-polyprenyl-6-methoxyphenol hydroxylase-like FAD-dependent oxidoreductase
MQTALISGASVAGPALAYWLQQLGWRVTVVERAAHLRPGGQAVDIRGVALEVVSRMGLLEEVRNLRTQPSHTHLAKECASRHPPSYFRGNAKVRTTIPHPIEHAAITNAIGRAVPS